MIDDARHSPAPAPFLPVGLPSLEDGDDAFLLRYLQANETPCPVCGYNLYALTAPRCPECGNAIRLRVVPRVPPMRAWITLTATLAATAGMGFLFLFVHAPDRFARWPGSFARIFCYAAIPLTLVSALFHRRFARLHAAWQWGIALTAAVAALVALVMIIVML